jgi:hypothetical protein
MSQSKHQGIVTALATMLAALSGVAVIEGRDIPLDTSTAKQVNLFLDDSTPSTGMLTGAPVDWITQLNVQIKARRTASSSAEAVADAVWVDAWQIVMADQSLGGLVQGLDLAPVLRERDEADTDVHCITWQFTVMHRTANNVLT